MFTRLKFDETLRCMEETEQWFSSLGITTANTRFKEYLSLISQLCKHQKEGTLELYLQDTPRLTDMYALIESLAFIDIFKAFRDVYSDGTLQLKFKKILKGPLLPQDESAKDNSNEGRNYLFELELAARLKSKGISIHDFDDVDFQYNNHCFNIQCKRPISNKPQTFATNLRKARQQLAERMNDANDRGIIAVAIEKLFGTDGFILAVTNEAQISAKVERKMNDFIKDNEGAFSQAKGKGILGTLLYFRFVVVVEDKNLLSRGTQLDIHPFFPENSPEYYLFTKLCKQCFDSRIEE